MIQIYKYGNMGLLVPLALGPVIIHEIVLAENTRFSSLSIHLFCQIRCEFSRSFRVYEIYIQLVLHPTT
jgi:hypothetical protein